ncbi:MAG: hypothetical protein H0W74_14130 [Sphingosinicella sp.]|nr:hypothetical protein [Sphingosinicella sp.]
MTHKPTAVVVMSDIEVVLTMSMDDARHLEDVLRELPTDHPTDGIWVVMEDALAHADRILVEMQD